MTTWTIKLNSSQKKKLIDYIKKSDFLTADSKNTYVALQAKKPGVTCTLYTSNKLVIQGSNLNAFIEFELEPYILEDTPYTQSQNIQSTPPHIGSDEAGKGDFFGPLCIAAAFATTDDLNWLSQSGICDSKKLTDKAILKLYPQITQKLKYEQITLMPFKYNELYAKVGNLNHLLAWAHVRLIQNLEPKVQAEYALVDQFANKLVIEQKLPKNFSLQVRQQHRAEEDLVVAAASVIARAQFLKAMDELSDKVGFDLPKGAGSPVIVAGKKLVKEQGAEILKLVSKTHFSTYNKVTCN